MKICFLIGSADIGGGTYVIFQHALHLHELGHDVTIVAVWPPNPNTHPWHEAIGVLKFSSIAEVADHEFDLVVATWWRTIYDLLPNVKARRYCYFVQSIESWFYPDIDVAVRNLVNATYLLPIPGVTEAKWIRSHIADQFGPEYYLAPNGCRKDYYYTDGFAVSTRKPGRLRVLVEGPLGVDFKNVARTIRLARQSLADEIWLLTATPVSSYPGVDRVFSRVPAAECGAVYRSCDVIVKLSTIEGMFGPPLEMFHCGGTAIVYDVTGHDEYIVHGRNALVVSTGDEAAVVSAINELKNRPDLLRSLQAGGLDTARAWPSWEHASSVFAEAIAKILAGPETNREQLMAMIREFWAAYLRTTKALPSNDLRRFDARMIAAIGRRFPRLEEKIRVGYAYLIESRIEPVPRERI